MSQSETGGPVAYSRQILKATVEGRSGIYAIFPATHNSIPDNDVQLGVWDIDTIGRDAPDQSKSEAIEIDCNVVRLNADAALARRPVDVVGQKVGARLANDERIA